MGLPNCVVYRVSPMLCEGHYRRREGGGFCNPLHPVLASASKLLSDYFSDLPTSLTRRRNVFPKLSIVFLHGYARDGQGR